MEKASIKKDTMTPINKKTTMTIVIEKRPFHSPEASILIKALDQELSEMYPDWPSLPHPGENIGLRGSLVSLNESPNTGYPTGESKVDTTATAIATEKVLSILDDAEPGMDEEDVSDSTGDATNAEADNRNEDKLILFIAYLVDQETMEEDGGQEKQNGSEAAAEKNEKEEKEEEIAKKTLPKAIGCMGIKIQKHYPHHHAAEEFEDEQVQSKVRQDIQRESRIKTAQLKRLYVDRAYRGTSSTSTSRSTTIKSSVANALLHHLEEHARQEMAVQRLVVETGVRQIGALKLYERAGWRKMEGNFGDYVSSTVDRGGVSVCFEKLL